MTLESKLCLICDDVAVIEVISRRGQKAALCGPHYEAYLSEDANVVTDEVCKYFDDGSPGDRPRWKEDDAEMWQRERKTDEMRGDYRTDEQETG